MSDEYQLRKDVDKLITLYYQINEILERNGVSTLKEFLNNYYDKYEIDRKLKSLDDRITALEDEEWHQTMNTSNKYMLL